MKILAPATRAFLIVVLALTLIARFVQITSYSSAGGSQSSSENESVDKVGPLQVEEEEKYKVGLDFFIMGYPKTGTTSMMGYLGHNDELKIAGKQKEFKLHKEGDVDRLFDVIQRMSLNSVKDGERYGIKWPGAISGKGLGTDSLTFIEKHNPEGTDTKLFVGIRHPVRWFESFYNYRHGGQPGTPSTTSLIGQRNSWRGVNTERARFEKGIMKLGKVPLQPEDSRYGVKDGGTPYKVFLYLTEQLGDHNKERKGIFLEELSSFLELKEPFTVENDVKVINKANKAKHQGIDICNPEHQPVREELVKNGKKTAQWIRSNLVEAEGFIMPNKEHFLSIVDTFGTDPCDDEDLLS